MYLLYKVNVCFIKYNKIMGHTNECPRALFKNPIKESFDITFMGNEKTVKTLIAFFSFPIKTFFN